MSVGLIFKKCEIYCLSFKKFKEIIFSKFFSFRRQSAVFRQQDTQHLSQEDTFLGALVLGSNPMMFNLHMSNTTS